MGKLDGKIAFITGVADNQGRAAALLFAREGASVVGADVKDCTQTLELVGAAGGRMIALSGLDLADAALAREWIAAGVAEFGRVDLLYNNAAAAKFTMFDVMSADDWSFTLRNELDILFHVTQAAWPHLIAAGGGSVINTASISAFRASSSFGVIAHSVGKAGVVAFTRQAALEGAPHKIRVNAISPGFIETEATRAVNERLGGRLTSAIPLGRAGAAEDVARCALFLASDDSSFITGENIVVDGGATVR